MLAASAALQGLNHVGRMQDPALFAEYERYTHGLKDILPIIEELKGVLHDYSDFNVSEVCWPIPAPLMPHHLSCFIA